MYIPYYKRNIEQIETTGRQDALRIGGYGGVNYSRGWRLDMFPLRVGDREVILPDVRVFTEQASMVEKNEDGSLGMDWIMMFDKVILNLKEMFLKGE